MNSKAPPVSLHLRPHGSQGFRDARNREAIARGFVVKTQHQGQPVYDPTPSAPIPSGNAVDPHTGLPRGNMAQIEADRIRQQAQAVGKAQGPAQYYPNHDGVSPVERNHISSNAPPYGQPPNYYQQLAEGHHTVPDDVRAAGQQRPMPRITPGHPRHIPPPMPPRVEPQRPQMVAHAAPPPMAVPLNRRPDHMNKARTYISSPREAPQGAAIKQGDRGGMYYENGGGATGNFPQGSKDEAHGKSPVPTTVHGQKTTVTAQPLSQEKTKVSPPPMPQDKKTQVSLAPIKETKTETEIQVPDFTPGGVDPKTGEDTAGIVAPDFESGKVDPKTGNVMAETEKPEETPTKEKPAKERVAQTPAGDAPPIAPTKPKSYDQSFGDAARGAYQYGKQTGQTFASGGQAFVAQMGQAPEQAAAAVSAHRKRAELDRQAHEAYQKEFENYQQAMRHHEAKQAHRQAQVEDKQAQDDSVQEAKEAQNRSEAAMSALSEDSQWAQPQQPDQAAPSGPSTFEQKMAQQEEQAAIPTPFQAQPQTAAPAGSQKQAESFRQDIKSFPQLSGFTTFIR